VDLAVIEEEEVEEEVEDVVDLVGIEEEEVRFFFLLSSFSTPVEEFVLTPLSCGCDV
jgi:hypothetical protein